ncbi:MAG: hypothetical protein ACR2GY_14345 [Phycisphaerales bacterium]
MSSFFSRKFLEMQQTARGATPLAEDVACLNCGYNLRGLLVGGRCPECGTSIPRKPGKAAILLPGDRGKRSRIQWGLTCTAVAIFVTAGVRLLAVMWWLAIDPRIITVCYLVLALLWTVGAFLVLVPDFARMNAKMKWARTFVLVSQPMWILAFASTLALKAGGTISQLATVVYWGRIPFLILATIGAVAFLVLVSIAAAELENDDQAGPLMGSAWGIVIFGGLAAVFPQSIIWLVFFLVFAPILLVYLFFMAKAGVHLWLLRRVIDWDSSIRARNALRDERINAVRAEIDRDVVDSIRPYR